ncbi:SICAvar, type I (fragment) [Plasmodium knowlesi strain H]|uniref:SICAvar, type I n=2 Tax=Plasmodium knowlesi TaxID=5850 RepID=A0A1A7VK05_PLAKH
MLKMAPTTQTTPSKTAKSPVDQQSRLDRGLEKLKEAFTDNLINFQPLLAKCKEGVDKTSNPVYKTHKDVLCEYITSAVRGTYGNKKSDTGSVFSGLKRRDRCYILRICMKYLRHHSCISEDDVTKILEAMKDRVNTWTLQKGTEEKNKNAFGRCIKKPWNKNYQGENDLKCKVIKIIKDSDRGKPDQLGKIKPSGGGSGTCPMNYDNGCTNGTAVGGPAAAGGGGGVDVDSEEDSEDEDDDEDDDDGVPTPSAPAISSSLGQGIRSSSLSLPGGKGRGKGRNLPFPSLSSISFDSIHPYLPLVPSILGIITITYFLWKYFGQLGKIRRFRRSPPEIPGPSVQEQVLDHVQQDSSHEYRLVKERKPRSAPTRTKRSGRDPAGSGRVNRRTIIEIHFEVLDECQKGDTQVNQKDFLELLVQEFMGSEFMEEEQVPKEEVLMEHVPILGSRLMV